MNVVLCFAELPGAEATLRTHWLLSLLPSVCERRAREDAELSQLALPSGDGIGSVGRRKGGEGNVSGSTLSRRGGAGGSVTLCHPSLPGESGDC